MSCRIARVSRDHTQVDPGFCCKCGLANLEVFFTTGKAGIALGRIS